MNKIVSERIFFGICEFGVLFLNFLSFGNILNQICFLELQGNGYLFGEVYILVIIVLFGVIFVVSLVGNVLVIFMIFC